MIPLAALADPSDLAGCVALATIAVVFGLLPAELVLRCWTRKMREIALLFGLAAIRRGASAMHLDLIEVSLQVATAVAATASILTTLRHLLREARRGRAA